MSELDKLVVHIENAENAMQWAADRIEKLEASTAWQPIETAPKDGTKFLAFYKQGIAIARWSERRMGKPNAFVTSHGCFAREFTHWMPLPGEPK